MTGKPRSVSVLLRLRFTVVYGQYYERKWLIKNRGNFHLQGPHGAGDRSKESRGTPNSQGGAAGGRAKLWKQETFYLKKEMYLAWAVARLTMQGQQASMI